MDVAYPLWESILCCGMCIGLLILFRETLNVQGRLGKLLASGQYAAYVWHPLLIVPLQLAIAGLQSPPFVKFVIITAVGVPIVFLWSRLSPAAALRAGGALSRALGQRRRSRRGPGLT